MKTAIEEYREKTCVTLSREGILNERIIVKINSIKKPGGIDVLCNGLYKQKLQIIQLASLAQKKGIEINEDLNFIISNLDSPIFKSFRDELTRKIIFVSRKAKTINNLRNAKVPVHIIYSLQQAMTINEIDRVLDTLPPIFLIKVGLFKRKKIGSSTTQKSIKAIYTPM